MWRKREEPKPSQPLSNSAPNAAPVSAPPQASKPLGGHDAPVPMTPVQPATPAATVAAMQPTPAPRAPEKSSSIISKGISVNGEVTGTEDLQVDGEIRGSLKMTGARVTVTPDGRASASIDAREVVIRGNMNGNIRATERVVVGSSGVWQGDAVAPRLMIEEGAIIHGKFEVAQPRETGRGNKAGTSTEREELATTRVGASS